MQTKSVSISKLKSNPHNTRKHSKISVERIARTLERFGQQKPIVVDKHGVVMAGNGTLEAAKLLGWKKINVVTSALAPKELLAYAIADNRASEFSEWDIDELRKTLDQLGEDEALQQAAGFLEGELDKLVKAGKREIKFEAAAGAPMGPVVFRVVVECKGGKDQARLIARLEKEGYKCAVLTS